MHLGLYHEPVHTDGKGFDTYGPFARYALEFTKHFEHVTVFAPTTDQPTYFSGYPLSADNLTVAALPFFQTHAQAYGRWRSILRVFRRHCDSLDVINARGTAPLAYALRWLTRKRPVPFLYHFASDPFEIIRTTPKFRGWYGRFARAAYGAEFAIQKAIMRRNYAFASGSALCRRLRQYTPNVEEVVDSTLCAADYHLREDCCRGEVVRLLYVGGLKPGKGLEDLIEAVGILRRDGRNVELELVGEGPLRESLERQVEEVGLERQVHFRGRTVMGPDLNARYDGADIFVLPSLSEGSPRCVLEALGHSLPVIATDVGNIAEMLDGGRRGVLIPPRDPRAVADAVVRIVTDEPLRKRCIVEGCRFARQHSVEVFVAQIARKAIELTEQRRSRWKK